MSQIFSVKARNQLGAARLVSRCIVGGALTLFGTSAFAQESELSLSDILDLKVTVASQKAMSLRESPGIVSVITEEDILRSGARDLIDLLHQVPGFQFGLDSNQVVGVSIRGNWGHEGKVLLIVDDHEMNETLYQTTQFGNEFPVDQIKRVEIIRGPGSAVYGGNAELAVIKITTKMGEDLKGGSVSVRMGQRANQTARQDVSAQIGGGSGDLSYRLGAFVGQGFMSGKTQTYLTGEEQDLSEVNEINPMQLTGRLKWKGLELSALYRDYAKTEINPYGTVLPEQVPLNFKATQLSAKYTHEVSPKWKVIPSLNYDRFSPWETIGDTIDRLVDEEGTVDDFIRAKALTERLRSDLRFVWDPTEEINVVFGAENIQDDAETTYPETFDSVDGNTLSFSSVAAYSQAIWQSDIANFTLGGRYYKHNVFGDSFVPRFAVTKVFGGLHLKGLWSKAFRAPGIKNLDINTDIVPEKTTVFEGEIGYALTHELSAVFNAFSTSIEDPIIYYVDEAEEDAYDNFEKTGSKGVEVALKWKTAHSRSDLSYSFYTNSGMNAVEKYVVEDGEGPTLGAAQHKIAWHGDTDLSANWNVGANLVYLGKNYSFEVSEDPADQADGAGTQTALDPVYLVDLVMTYKNLGIQGLDLSAGVYNILDQDYRFVQPYDGGQSAMPSLDREGVIRVSYTKQF